jgi:hypothetical protein
MVFKCDVIDRGRCQSSGWQPHRKSAKPRSLRASRALAALPQKRHFRDAAGVARAVPTIGRIVARTSTQAAECDRSLNDWIWHRSINGDASRQFARNRSGGIGRRWGSGAGGPRGPGLEELLFAINHGVDVVWGQFDAVSVGDGIGGAGFDAITAENAARIVDVVGLGVALTGGNALCFRIFRSFDENTVRGARSRAKKAGHAFFEAVFVALKDVDPTVARLDARRHVRESLGRGLAEHGPQRDAEPLNQRRKSFSDFTDNGWHLCSLYQNCATRTICRFNQNRVILNIGGLIPNQRFHAVRCNRLVFFVLYAATVPLPTPIRPEARPAPVR